MPVAYNARDVGTKGYDASTGFGVLNVRKALEGDPGPHDPGEPNDDIDWVDGREFGRADPVLYKGRGRAKRLRATVDETEDPYDVYRVRARGHRRVKVTANPSYGNITLTAFSPRTRSTAQRKRRVARSARRGGRTERITIRNRSRRARVYFVAIEVARGSRLDAGYVLRAAKGRRATG